MWTTYIILIIILIILLLVSINNCKLIEKFDTFSPYMGNHAYPFVYQKNKDQQELRSTLKKWEYPFNTNSNGYRDMEYNKNPPFVNLNSYEDLKQVRFTIPQNKNDIVRVSPPTFSI
jgi:predicted membrane-bound dolichyl-phosphate-mannose-protein mannosyltransferase